MPKDKDTYTYRDHGYRVDLSAVCLEGGPGVQAVGSQGNGATMTLSAYDVGVLSAQMATYGHPVPQEGQDWLVAQQAALVCG